LSAPLPRLKFAVVREDPALEQALIEHTRARALLTVASGGCTLLTLAKDNPTLELVGFDFNPRQLEHVKEKARCLGTAAPQHFNVLSNDAAGLNQRGEFEGLFRTLRLFVEEFVAPRRELNTFFDPGVPESEREALRAGWFASHYWPVAFQLAFADPLLHAMFGPAATQHARPGSYPGYFQALFERGLRREDACRNPYLQHVLLGAYRPGDAPGYLRATAPLQVCLVQGSLPDVPDLGRFDVISLSNIFDWSDDTLVEAWATLLSRKARPGCAVLLRQLNNQRDLRRFFAPAFEFDDALGARLQAQDRSLFYERVEVGFRRTSGT
jgi:S-adenosylmethionine-diacylglycerol 3-amino-3-carboxypropyl transferase